MAIKITCGGEDFLPLESITEFQGNLKKRSKQDIEKIIKSIRNYGFSFPFFIWKYDDINFCLDGHGRILGLNEMKKTGEEIPDLPVVYIQAADEDEAKNKLLRLNSQYGIMTADSIMEFAGDMELNLDELSFPNISFDNSIEESIYTDKIVSPIYEPRGEKPEISKLVDADKTNGLIAEINNSNVMDDEKTFLILSAQRHLKFNYQNIADYYAHASQEMKHLMEKSALVIIDYEQAIEQGFVDIVKKTSGEITSEE